MFHAKVGECIVDDFRNYEVSFPASRLIKALKLYALKLKLLDLETPTHELEDLKALNPKPRNPEIWRLKQQNAVVYNSKSMASLLRLDEPYMRVEQGL